MKITFREYVDSLPNPKTELIKELAKLTLSTETTVYRWMSGESIPPVLKREAIAEYLGIPALELWPSKSKEDE